MNQNNTPIGIYCMGASGVGKTTLAKIISIKYGIPLISGIMSEALKEKNMTPDDVDPLLIYQQEPDEELAEKMADAQMRAMEMQLQVEQYHVNRKLEKSQIFLGNGFKPIAFIADRCIDYLSYTTFNSYSLSDVIGSRAFYEYIRQPHFSESIFFYIPPYQTVVESARNSEKTNIRRQKFLTWDVIYRVDGVICFMLQSGLMGIPFYHCITTDDLDERVKCVTKIIQEETSIIVSD